MVSGIKKHITAGLQLVMNNKIVRINPLSANPTKLSVFDHFVGLALKGLR